MLDKLKDLVPEVDEDKANLIYQKSLVTKQKTSINFNYKLVIRLAALIILCIPVFFIFNQTKNSNGSQAPSYKPEYNGDANEDASTPESSMDRFLLDDGISYLYIIDVRFSDGFYIVSINVSNSVFYINDLDNVINKIMLNNNAVNNNNGLYYIEGDFVEVYMDSLEGSLYCSILNNEYKKISIN